MSDKSIRRFTDTDAALLRYMARHYGIDGLCHELWCLLTEWARQNPQLYGSCKRAANKLAYRSKLAVGKAVRPAGF